MKIINSIKQNINKKNIINYSLLILFGIFHAFSISWPFSLFYGQVFWWLQIITFAGFFYILISAKTKKEIIIFAQIFATIWLIFIFWWLFISLSIYGSLNEIFTAILIFLLACFVGSYYTFIIWIWYKFNNKNLLNIYSIISFACLWSLAEIARGFFFTGFPWGAVGYAHVDGPLNVFARLIGVYGISFIAVFLALILVYLIKKFKTKKKILNRKNISYLLLFLFIWISAFISKQNSEKEKNENNGIYQKKQNTKISLLQSNIDQRDKFTAEGISDSLNWHREQLLNHQEGLIITSETALPYSFTFLKETFLNDILEDYKNPNKEANKAILIGSIFVDENKNYTNSLIGISQANNKKEQKSFYRYDKFHLVPFGEFVPPMFRWLTDLMKIPLGDFSRGKINQDSFEWNGERFAPNICYEDVFGEEMAVKFKKSETAPTILVNVSNIGWFGNTVAIPQHLNISRMRALELQRPIIRATNTGATAIINHKGEVLSQLKPFTRNVLKSEIKGRTNISPYVFWLQFCGLYSMIIFYLLLIILAKYLQNKK